MFLLENQVYNMKKTETKLQNDIKNISDFIIILNNCKNNLLTNKKSFEKKFIDLKSMDISSVDFDIKETIRYLNIKSNYLSLTIDNRISMFENQKNDLIKELNVELK